MLRGEVLGVALVVMVATPSAARAHGALPRVHTAFVRPGNPAHLVVETNFGLIVSKDKGKSWGWICDEVISNDIPHFSVFLGPGEDIWAGSPAGVFVSRDHGCTWSAVTDFATSGASDLASAPGDPSTLYATTDSRSEPNHLKRSSNGGASFADTALDAGTLLLTTVRVAPSNRQRLYVGGWGFSPSFSAHLFVSDDEAQSFSRVDLPASLGPGGAFYVWAVHPTKPKVLIASLNLTQSPFERLLLRSDDSGQSFTVVLRVADVFNQVAFSEDGAWVWAASEGGLYRSSDEGRTFTELTQPHQKACVARAGDTLYACGWPVEDGWALGQSADQGDTWYTALKLSRVAVANCGAGSNVETVCGPLFPAQQVLFPPEAPAPDPPESPPPPPPPTDPEPVTSSWAGEETELGAAHRCETTGSETLLAALLALRSARRPPRGRRQGKHGGHGSPYPASSVMPPKLPTRVRP
jgi:photosystem II stability/assembly factor-like uncharacterized protein